MGSSSTHGDTWTSGSGKEGLGWMEWARGWYSIVGEFFFQRISASHLESCLPLPTLQGLTCIVTGATSGIGLQVARQLSFSGAHVVMAVRRTGFAHELIHKWQNEGIELHQPLDLEVMELDLLSLDSVVQFAEAWNSRLCPLNVLINNAGIFSIGEPQKFSKDGYEEHLQVNHLAPALLAMLLMPSLVRGSPSRIINVNSIMHVVGFVDANDMNIVSGKTKYTSLKGYCNSKLAQVKFSSILHKKLPDEAGISVVCVNPGVVHTNVARDLPKFMQSGYRLIPYFLFDAQEGSRSTLFAATNPQIEEYTTVLKADEWPTCACISSDCRPTNASEEAHNLATSQMVWEKTLELIGLPVDALEKLIEGEAVQCRYGGEKDQS